MEALHLVDKMDLKVILLAVLAISASAEKYELMVADEEVFHSCPDPEPGTLDIYGLADLSELSTTMDADGVTLTGNATLRWDVQPEDRIEMSAKLLYMDRGTWTPTVFSLLSKDFCKVMYDKNQLWYKYWTGHIINDVKNCINVAGVSTKFTLALYTLFISLKYSALQTKYIHEKYVLSLTATAMGPVTEGRYKANIVFRAYDSSGELRPTRICVEVQGDLSKVRRSKPF
ncbi:uncharacterized protein LOC6538141 isoform X1 [Drosophila yakuba]|uniref:uncharacterized protein LOC6538141 isoform X1 n=1 Tax=Drosophila yakuba TaxID=7245 RepID=UPI001930827D|nr:uncharacterized protein LOC6538141 isoform X1 [Drosophila yakuba]